MKTKKEGGENPPFLFAVPRENLGQEWISPAQLVGVDSALQGISPLYRYTVVSAKKRISFFYKFHRISV